MKSITIVYAAEHKGMFNHLQLLEGQHWTYFCNIVQVKVAGPNNCLDVFFTSFQLVVKSDAEVFGKPFPISGQ